MASSRFERGGVAENARGELVAIDLAAGGGAGKRRLDRGHGLALVEAVHHRVGVVHRHAFLGEEARRRRLSHSERAGEAEDEHAVCNSLKAAAIHAASHPRVAGIAQQRQQRQAENREMIALDALEQLDAEPSPAGSRRRSR